MLGWVWIVDSGRAGPRRQEGGGLAHEISHGQIPNRRTINLHFRVADASLFLPDPFVLNQISDDGRDHFAGRAPGGRP